VTSARPARFEGGLLITGLPGFHSSLAHLVVSSEQLVLEVVGWEHVFLRADLGVVGVRGTRPALIEIRRGRRQRAFQFGPADGIEVVIDTLHAAGWRTLRYG